MQLVKHAKTTGNARTSTQIKPQKPRSLGLSHSCTGTCGGRGSVCIFLVLLVGAAHLLHTHPADALNGDQSEANCSLCVVAHLAASPAPVVAGPAIAVLLRTIAPPKACPRLDPVLRSCLLYPSPACSWSAHA